MNFEETRDRIARETAERIAAKSGNSDNEPLKSLMETMFKNGWTAALTMATSLPMLDLIDELKKHREL